MNLKQKALLHTAGIIAGMAIASLLISYLVNSLTAVQGTVILGIVVIGMMLLTIYNIVLARLEYHQSLADMVEKHKEI